MAIMGPRVAKFPRIPHLPWSQGGTRDDDRLGRVDHLLGRPLVITEKLDGGNVCLTRANVFARTHSGPPTHPVYDWLKAAHAEVRRSIPKQLSLFCEYLYFTHTIEYENLPSYLFLIAVRDESMPYWLSWEETIAIGEMLKIPPVPVLASDTIHTESALRSVSEDLGQAPGCYGEREGIVVRLSDRLTPAGFEESVAKWTKASL